MLFHTVLETILLALLLAACCSPWGIFVLKLAELWSKRLFFRRMAWQTARAGSTCALFSLVLFLLLTGLACRKLALENAQWLQDSLDLFAAALSAPLLFALSLLLLRFILGQGRASRAGNVGAALLALVCALLGLLTVTLPPLRFLNVPELLPEAVIQQLQAWSWPLYSPFEPLAHLNIPARGDRLLMAGQLASAGLALCVNLTLCSALLRRGADYGRDYYNFMLRYGALGVAVCAALSAVCGLTLRLALLARTKGLYNPDIPAWWVYALLYAVCVLFWTLLGTAQTPLRRKAGLWLSLPALLLGLMLHLLFLKNIYLLAPAS